MIVGVAVAELHIPEARSLKDKRRVIKSVLDRVWRKHQVSAAEIQHQNLHQRAQLGFALVNSDRRYALSALESIQRVVDSRSEAFLTDWRSELVEDFS